MSRMSLADYRKLSVSKQKQKNKVEAKSVFRTEKVESVGEATLNLQLKALKIVFEREFQFHPSRRWRSDFHLVGKKILIEVEGGIWTQGRHTRAKGYLEDMDKYNEATILGYQVLRFSTEQVQSGFAVKKIQEVLKEQ